jgi:hypothetical protein
MARPALNIELAAKQKKELRLRTGDSIFGPQMGGEVWNRFTVHCTPKHGSWLHQDRDRNLLAAMPGKEEHS